MDHRIIELCDPFTHGTPTRREFPDRLGKRAGSAAAALPPLLQNNCARAGTIAGERLARPNSEGVGARRFHPCPKKCL